MAIIRSVISRPGPPGGGQTAEQVRDTMATALVAGANVTITPNDGLDTITIAAGDGGTGDLFNVLDYGAVGDGTTDDREAFQDALDAIHANGGGTLVVPAGYTFKLGFRTGFYGGSFKVACFIYGSNVTVQIDGTIYLDAGHVNGFNIFANAPNVITPANVDSSGSWWLDHYYLAPEHGDALYPTYEIDPVAQGDNSVTLATPGDHVNFAVGDIGHFRSGQTTTHAAESLPDSFIDEIIAIDTGTGELTLRTIAPKPLVQEYFADAGKTGPTTTGSTAYPALFGVQNVTDVAVRNIKFIGSGGFEVDQEDGRGYAFNLGTIIGYEIAGLRMNGKNCVLQSGGPYRHARFHNNAQFINLTEGTDAFFTGDRGCGDVKVDHNTLVSFGTDVCTLPFNEGTFNVVIDSNKITTHPNASDNHAIQARARGWNIAITNNDVDYVSSATGEPIDTESNVIGLYIDGNRTNGKPCGISGQNIRMGTHDGPLYINSPLTSAVQSLDFTYDYTWADSTDILVGYIPARAYVSFVDVMIVVTFNGTTPRLFVGDDASGNAFVNNAVMSGSAWTHPALGRDAENGYYQNQSGAVNGMLPIYVYAQQGGSSAGRAKVVIHWALSQDIPGV